mmetsp:Transcript_26541/g.61766  ORF Transcript_26541/g.61766 Transcript_26541/m.61766 type:complete len:207 (-) Transcript_26541:642-1262(-)
MISPASSPDAAVDRLQVLGHPAETHAGEAADVQLCPREDPFRTCPNFATARTVLDASTAREVRKAQCLTSFQTFALMNREIVGRIVGAAPATASGIPRWAHILPTSAGRNRACAPAALKTLLFTFGVAVPIPALRGKVLTQVAAGLLRCITGQAFTLQLIACWTLQCIVAQPLCPGGEQVIHAEGVRLRRGDEVGARSKGCCSCRS